MKPAIRVDSVSKRYRIVARQASYTSLREAVVGAARAPLQRLRRNGRSGGETIWALKRVSFEVHPGEVVGLIGNNGAGKSTLLKIVSRITEPTSGRIELRGRVGSLLEVGTGFHPELTGKENIFLNGAIIGMKRSEIKQRFDEIVAFAEIEKFLDTPVKYYSSGMYMRLAFAVAAHLESDILLVDEVLAVGDADFQKKCLGKMHDVARQGRTVLLVSHNMLSILRLCKKVVWLNRGQVEMAGPSEEVISKYLLRKSPAQGEYVCDEAAAADASKVLIRAVRIRNGGGEVSATIDARQPFDVEIDYEIFEPISFIWVGFVISTVSGIDVLAAADGDVDHYITSLREPGRYTSVCRIPGNLFNAGSYTVSAYAAKTLMGTGAEIFTFLEHVLTFNIEHPGGIGSYMPSPRVGVLSPKLSWEVNLTALQELTAARLSNDDY
jgi:lipopolysaccharide transport system ATP-binding protein